MRIPNIFNNLVKSSKNSNAGGYPYQIKAIDLDANFAYVALDAHDGLIEETSGPNGNTTRKLKIPAVPKEGTHVLGVVEGILQWIATEEC